jgi:hypothetical protein
MESLQISAASRIEHGIKKQPHTRVEAWSDGEEVVTGAEEAGVGRCPAERAGDRRHSQDGVLRRLCLCGRNLLHVVPIGLGPRCGRVGYGMYINVQIH